MKHAARRPRPPLPSPGSSSCCSSSSKSRPELAHALPHRLEDAEVDQVVAEVRAHEEFGREIRDGARSLLGVGRGGADPALQHAVADRIGQRHVVVVLGGQGRELALHVEEIVEERALDGLLVEVGAAVAQLLHGAQITSTGTRFWRSTARTGISSTGPAPLAASYVESFPRPR